jgi:hypothetical protein
VVLGVDEQIFWLDVSMDDVITVAEFYCFEQLVDVFLDRLRVKAIGLLLQYLEQVLLKILEDQVQSVFPENR